MKIDKTQFKNYSIRTQSTIFKLIDTIEKNFSEIDEAWIVNLEALAMNYDLFYAAYDDLKANGNTKTDYKDRLSKNPSITIYNNCQNAIQGILSRMGLNVLSKARAKSLMNTEVETDEFERTFG